jgi:hypothetical protein
MNMSTTTTAPARRVFDADAIRATAADVYASEVEIHSAGNDYCFRSGHALLLLLPHGVDLYRETGESDKKGVAITEKVSVTAILKEIAKNVTEFGKEHDRPTCTISWNTLQQRRKIALMMSQFPDSFEVPVLPWSTWQTLVTYWNYRGRQGEMLEWITEYVDVLQDGENGRIFARDRVKVRNPNAFEQTGDESSDTSDTSDTSDDAPVDSSLGIIDSKALGAFAIVRDAISGALPVQPDTFATIVDGLREALSNVPENVPDSVTV